MTDLLITGIGELTTNAVGLGDDEADPTGLIRDAAVLVHDHGYELASAGVVNMFPHTAHVESIAVFERE